MKRRFVAEDRKHIQRGAKRVSGNAILHAPHLCRSTALTTGAAFGFVTSLSEARQNISIASGGEATESAWPPDRIDPLVRGANETANIKRHLNASVGAGDKLRARALRMGDLRHPPDCLRWEARRPLLPGQHRCHVSGHNLLTQCSIVRSIRRIQTGRRCSA